MGLDRRDCSGRGAARAAHAPPLRFEKRPCWCAAADAGLAAALGDYAHDIRQGVDAGRMELFRVDASWMVTEVRAGALIVWCYQGRAVRRVAEILMRVAVNNGLDTLEYSTKLRSLGRLLRSLGFDLVAIDDEGIARYQVAL